MGKKLTEAQRKARATIRDAARKLIAEFDATSADGKYPYRRNCDEFVAHIHLDCIGPAIGHYLGEPIKQNYPIYRQASRH